MNLLQLVQALQRESGTGNQAISSVASLSGESLRLLNWVLQADLTIQSLVYDWLYLWVGDATAVTTGIGVNTYAGPSDLNVWDRESFFIDGTAVSVVEDFDRSTFPRTAATGKPNSIYILPNNQLRVYPTPDAAYDITFDYWKKPVQMAVANTSESVIPSQFRYAIVFEALSYYATFENAQEAMAKASQGISTWLPKLEAHQKPGHQGGTLSNGYDFAIQAV